MRRAEIIMAGVLAMFSIYLMWKSTELNVGYVLDEGPGGGAWPFWLSGIMLICTAIIGYNGVKRKSPPSQSEEPLLDRYATKMLFLVGGGIFGFIALIDVISMYGAMCVFLLYYLGFLGRHSLKLTLTMAILVPVIFFFFFEALMRITMPKGLPFLEPLFNYMNTIIY
ncbi:MAG: putative tricarboxylic transport membrane protein [Porticoccaceae bacterium]|jgi:putative tricarboxylic transport membrane protein